MYVKNFHHYIVWQLYIVRTRLIDDNELEID